MSQRSTVGAVGAARAGVVDRAVDRLTRVPLVVVVAVAIGVRVLAGLAFTAADTDTYEFGWLARNIVDGRGYSYFADDAEGRLTPGESDELGDPFPSAYMPPVYTYLTAGASQVADSHAGTVWLLRLANIAAAAAGVVLMHALARRLVGPRAAVLAALGFAVYPALVYASTQVSAANLYIPLELGVLLLLLRAARSASWSRWAFAGASVGLLCLVRAEAVALIPLAALWLAWTAGRQSRAGHRIGLTVLFVGVASAIPGAWVLRNSLALDGPVLTVVTTGGKNLWIGNHDGASGSQKDFDIPASIEDEIRDLDAGDDFEVRADAIYRREAVESMTGDPLGTAWRDLKKVGLLLGADVYDKRNLNPLYLGPYLVIAAAGTAGFVGWWRRRPKGDTVGWLVLGYAVFSVAVPAVFFALARYRLPVEMLLLVFSAAWLSGRTSGGDVAPGHERTPSGLEPHPQPTAAG
jgi:4-amino-4-deoxy-L-arabinose transferase-like glycosyltransferase